MPLGGVATGCLDLETNGELGFSTQFNWLLPRQGPHRLPFLGLKLGDETWLLSTRSLPGLKAARDIRYWGHYPIADLEYDLDAPVAVSLRAWSPFIPGDVAASNIPAIVFAVTLTNNSAAKRQGTLAITHPGVGDVMGPFFRDEYHGPAGGVVCRHGSADVSYFLGFIGEVGSRIGSGLGVDGSRWAAIDRQLPAFPQPEARESAASTALDFELEPGETRTIKLLMAWYAPTWNGRGLPMGTGQNYLHMYARDFDSLQEVIEVVSRDEAELLRRTIAWQDVIYGESSLPAWLKDTLINSLHMITETAVWGQGQPPVGNWCRPEDGVFGMNESPRACPQIECIPCTFYGNLPIVYLFPRLALANLRAHKAYQYPNGRPAWIFGAPYEIAAPTEGYQQVLNGSCYAEIFNKLWLASARDPELLQEFYESLKKSTEYTMTMRPEYGVKQVISMPSGNVGDTWHESTQFYGMVTQIAGIHLAHLQMAREWARAMNDTDWLASIEERLAGGKAAAEEFLWNGKAYRLYNEPETNRLSDVLMGYQLDGDWISRFHGLGGVFQPERSRTALDTLRAANADPARWPHGALVFAAPDGKTVGSEFNPGYWTATGTHLPATLMLGMSYMQHGQTAFGLDLCRRAMTNVVAGQRGGWDWGILYDAISGRRIYGNDYYQMLMLWSLPAVLAGGSLEQPLQQGELVHRMLAASAASQGNPVAAVLSTTQDIGAVQGFGGWSCGFLTWPTTSTTPTRGAASYRADGLQWFGGGMNYWAEPAPGNPNPSFALNVGRMVMNSQSGDAVSPRWATRQWVSETTGSVRLTGTYDQNGGGPDGARLLLHRLRGAATDVIWSVELPAGAVAATRYESPPCDLQPGDILEMTLDPLQSSAGNWVNWRARIQQIQ